MTSRRQRKGNRIDTDQVEDNEVQLTSEANANPLEANVAQLTPATRANSPEAGQDTYPASTHEDTESETENTSASLSLILKELRNVGKEVKEFRNDTKLQLQSIRGELDKANLRLNEVESRVSENEDKLQNTDEILSELISTHEKMHLKMTSLEAYSRRETLRIFGVPEGAESGSQSIAHFVEKLLRDNLNIPPTMELQIQRAHRALASPPPDGSRPRSILVKFLCFTVKEEVLRLAWQKKGFVWNSSKINIDHDFPPEIMAMRKEYAESRRVLKEKNLRFRTLYPARLKVFYEEGAKIYETVEAATADLASRGLPVKVVKPATTLREKLQRCAQWRRAGEQHPRQHRGAAGFKEKLQVFRREST